MTNSKIVLGPLLGVESDSLYTVCILIDPIEITKPENLTLLIRDKIFTQETKYPLNKYLFVRFVFEMTREDDHGLILNYSIRYEGKDLESGFGMKKFTFQISGKNQEPGIVLVSCNGSHDKYISDIPEDDFLGWDRILCIRPDLLIMGGDQIYSDIIWQKNEKLKNILMNDGDVSTDVIQEIDDFFCQLYIDSWNKKTVGITLACIPNIMNWDDHDIIDGYGSLPENFHKTKLMQTIFNIAQKYYSLFQMRGNNTTLIAPDYDFTYVLEWKNYILVGPDTRSKRTRCNILDSTQYTNLENKLLAVNVQTNDKNKVVAFILPVPIAHRKYDTKIEQLTETIFNLFKRSFTWSLKKSLDDDMRDHWEHHAHEAEQIEMLDLIFNTGINHKAKNVMVLSGDVHFGGASRVDKSIKNTAYTVTQVISSPIVNSPFSAIVGNISAHFSKDTNEVGPYIVSDFKEFGDYKKKMVTQRNFIHIKRSNNGALTLSMFHEPWGDKPYFRRVNNFV